jgi:hypothetical protein
LDCSAREEGANLVITRCPVTSAKAVHALETHHHCLMDTLIRYEGSTADGARVPAIDHEVRPARLEDRSSLAMIAQECFSGYLGHYHADPRLDPSLATAGYVEWCLSSLDLADHVVLVALQAARVVGFLIFRRSPSGRAAEIVLNGVAASERGKGTYSALLGRACRLMNDAGTETVQISTQISNFTPQRVWCRHAFRPTMANYTFHKWFNTTGRLT